METSIEKRVAELENLVFLSKNVLSFDEASKFLNLSKSYLYKLTSGNLIPHYKPQGKMLYFEKAELEAWLRQNPVKTQAQIEQEAQKYILNRPFAIAAIFSGTLFIPAVKFLSGIEEMKISPSSSTCSPAFS